MPVTVPHRLTPGAQVRVDPTDPLAQGLFAVHLPMRWLLASQGSAMQLSTTSWTRGSGATGFTGSTSDSIPGFQTGPWSYFACYTPLSVTSRCIAAMCEFPGNGVNDRILGLDVGGNFVAYLYDGSTKVVTSSTVAAAGVAYSLAAVSDGSVISLWVNGLREATTSVGAAGYDGYTTPELTVGRVDNINLLAAADLSMDGSLHIFAAWRRALTANEIARLYGDPFAFLRR